MTAFFEFKAKATGFYKEYEAYFRIAFKFFVAYFVFTNINSSLGFYKALDNTGIEVVLSLISAIVPSSIFVLMAAILSILHLYKLSLIMTVLALVVFIVFYFLYLKFAPEHGVLMLIIPVLMPLNLHFIVPLLAGLFFSPFTIVPIGCCFVIMKFVEYIIEAAPMVDMRELDVTAIAEGYQFVIDHVLDNKEMLIYAGVFALMIVITFVISRLPFDYSWYAGIGLGALAGIIGILVGSSMHDVSISAGGVIFGCILSGLLTAAVQFMRCSVDYNRKERVQFEDDDYYYYVKAIPKLGAAKTPETKESVGGSILSRLKNKASEAKADAATKDVPEDLSAISDDSFGDDFDGDFDFSLNAVDTAVEHDDYLSGDTRVDMPLQMPEMPEIDEEVSDEEVIAEETKKTIERKTVSGRQRRRRFARENKQKVNEPEANPNIYLEPERTAAAADDEDGYDTYDDFGGDDF